MTKDDCKLWGILNAINCGFLLCVLVVFVMPMILLLTLGYMGAEGENDDLIRANCTVTDHTIEERTCSEQCNCVTTCFPNGDGDNTCTTSCSTCDFACYNGVIDISLAVNVSFTDEKEVITASRSEGNVEDRLEEDYPIDGNITCFYSENNPSNIRLRKRDTQNDFLAGTIVLAVFSGIFLMVYAMILLGLCIWGLIIAIKYVNEKRTPNDDIV